MQHTTQHSESSIINDTLKSPQQRQQQPTPDASHSNTQPSATIDINYRRQKDGPILWFSGPPVDIKKDNAVMHSLSYLEWKANKKNNFIK